MLRREEAAQKAKKQPKVPDKIKYEIDNGDIVLLSGPYAGQYASHVFVAGAEERDWVIKNLWFTHDERVMVIIRGFLCQ